MANLLIFVTWTLIVRTYLRSLHPSHNYAGALSLRRPRTVAFVCMSARLSLRLSRTPDSRRHSTSYSVWNKTLALIITVTRTGTNPGAMPQSSQ
jgi:hypothetical protein